MCGKEPDRVKERERETERERERKKEMVNGNSVETSVYLKRMFVA